MSENGKKVLDYLKKSYPTEVTKDEIVTATGVKMPAVNAALIGIGSLKRKGLLDERVDVVNVNGADKKVYHYVLNVEGLAYEE